MNERLRQLMHWALLHFGVAVLYIPWATANRLEWHRIERSRVKGCRLFGTWYLLYGKLVPM